MAYKFNPFTGNFDQLLDKASEIKYDNSSSGLIADVVQDAIDELQTTIDNLPTPMQYLGTWDASTNTPTLSNTDTDALGHVYYVNVGGTVNFGAGNITFSAGDRVVNDGSIWQKWDAVDAVTSVNLMTGDVTLDSDDISEGATNLYFTDARAQGAISGGASSIVTSNLTANRALASDGSGKVAVSSVTDTELGYVSGVTSAIQTQLNAKLSLSTVTVTGTTHTATSGTVVLCKHTAALVITLPTPSTNATVVIKDASGTGSETNNITVNSPTGSIDNEASLIIASNKSTTMLISDGTDWWVI